MFSRFFIDRPIFASVLSILITIAGGIAVFTLPIAQYPSVAPPTVQVDCNYPGATPRSWRRRSPLRSNSRSTASRTCSTCPRKAPTTDRYTLTVTFKPGMNLNLAQVLVQNRVSLSMPLLPDVVRQTGVTTKKRAPDILLTVSLNSPSGRYDQLYLSNYAVLQVRDELSRLPGISEVLVFGQRDYSMRSGSIRTSSRSATWPSSDVINALREQNMQIAAGQIGQPPATSGTAAANHDQDAGARSPRPNSSRTSSSARRTRARSCASRILAVSIWAVAAKTSTIASTASRPSAWPSFNCRTPTPWKRPTWSKPR